MDVSTEASRALEMDASAAGRVFLASSFLALVRIRSHLTGILVPPYRTHYRARHRRDAPFRTASTVAGSRKHGIAELMGEDQIVTLTASEARRA